MLGRKVAVHVAEAVPEEHAYVVVGVRGVEFSADGVISVDLRKRAVAEHAPDGGVGDPELARGVDPEVKVGEEEYRQALIEKMQDDFFRVARGADAAALASRERLEVCPGIHVGDGNDSLAGSGSQGVEDVARRLRVYHVRHRASGVPVGKENLLPLAREYRGAFRHKSHAA